MIEYPSIIYKYRTWNKNCHQDILKKNEIYFASPSELNDPFDFKIHINWRSLSDDQIVKFADLLYNRHPNPPKQYKEFIIHRIKFDKNLQSNSDDFIVEKDNLDFGVLSLSKTYKNIPMWSHYGDSHKGFCVGFNSKNLIDSEKLYGNHVNYYENFPEVSPLELTASAKGFIKAFSKSIHWEYEQEFRILKLEYNGFNDSNNRKHNFSDSAIQEIILGMKISKEDKDEIIQIAKIKNVKIYQIYQLPFSFEIEKREIDFDLLV